jgi:hypothetical protein
LGGKSQIVEVCNLLKPFGSREKLIKTSYPASHLRSL